jgi:hypothetical protein
VAHGVFQGDLEIESGGHVSPDFPQHLKLSGAGARVLNMDGVLQSHGADANDRLSQLDLLPRDAAAGVIIDQVYQSKGLLMRGKGEHRRGCHSLRLKHGDVLRCADGRRNAQYRRSEFVQNFLVNGVGGDVLH